MTATHSYPTRLDFHTLPPPLARSSSMLSCPHEATAVVVVGARAVADATPPCSADASSTTKQSTFLLRGAAPWSPSCTAVVAQRFVCRCRHAVGGKEVRSNPLHSPLIRRLCMFYGQQPGAPRNTSTSTPSPGINSTFTEPEVIIQVSVLFL